MQSEQPIPFARFDFDLTAAVLSQLVATFNAMAVGPLTAEMLAQVDAEQGVYQLYLGDKLMYVGKAVDSLPTRLRQHLQRLREGNQVNEAELGFKCLTVSRNWMNYADVASLTAHYRRQRLCEWNDRES